MKPHIRYVGHPVNRWFCGSAFPFTPAGSTPMAAYGLWRAIHNRAVKDKSA